MKTILFCRWTLGPHVSAAFFIIIVFFFLRLVYQRLDRSAGYGNLNCVTGLQHTALLVKAPLGGLICLQLFQYLDQRSQRSVYSGGGVNYPAEHPGAFIREQCVITNEKLAEYFCIGKLDFKTISHSEKSVILIWCNVCLYHTEY